MTTLKNMSLVEALKLRVAVDNRIRDMRAEIDTHWDEVFPNGNAPTGRRIKRVKIKRPKERIKRIKLKANHSPFKGIKVKPKYRGPDGDTWTGRGVKPKWLVAVMKKTGKKASNFLIKQ